MKDFLGTLFFIFIVIAAFISIIAVDKWFGPFWALLLSLILFIAFLIVAMIAVGYAMEAISKYRSEVEMSEAEEINMGGMQDMAAWQLESERKE